MQKEALERMLRHNEYEKLIVELEKKNNKSEYELLVLIQAYLFMGEENKAVKQMIRLNAMTREDSFYWQDVKKLEKAIMEDEIEDYLEELKASLRGMETLKAPVEAFSDEIEELFDGVAGMNNAKRKLQIYLDSRNLNTERTDNGFADFIEEINHFIVVGERGSGKSRLSEIIAKMLYFEEENIEYLYARNIKERKDLDSLFHIKGKLVIIENMEDLLCNEDVSKYAQFDIINALEDLIIFHSEEDDCRFIFTGVAEAFEKMKLLNPSIETHFFEKIVIEKYSVDELWQILNLMAFQDKFHINPACEEEVRSWLAAESKLKDFTNTIALENLLKEAKKHLAVRFQKFQEEEGSHIFEIDEELLFQKMCRIDPEDFKGNGDEKSVEELCKELEAMTGLESVKAEVRKQVAKLGIAMKAAKAGSKRKNGFGTLHMAFVGEPGTGKTTVAKIVGKIYCALGILPGDEVYMVSRADLVSQYIGGTARCVREVCQRADGGVLFIDEAYSMVNSEQDSYGKEAVDTLIQEMENRRDTMMVILAGYEEPMLQFFKANPGFKSRVPNFIHFDDYSLDEMVKIFEHMVTADGYYMTADALELLHSLLEVKSKAVDFGNARGVRNVLDQVISAQSMRLDGEDKLGKTLINYDEITAEDIRAIQNIVDTEEKTIEELLEQLYALEGLQGVKSKVDDMVKSMQYIKFMQNRNLDPGKNQGTMHLIFSGNPGTGKSTVANLLGQIYVKLGVLKKNNFILAKRSDLVAQYMGQTAARVANKVAEADGGILFIDEAYQLYTGENDSYGEEAIGTLLSLVEEKRDSLMVILAGYTENMEDFLRVNPGLRSRFPNVIEFTDYSIDELLTIFEKMAKADGKILEEGVLELVEDEVRVRKKKDEKEFANARGVRNILDKMILRQRSRIINEEMKGISHSDEELVTIKKEDI